VALNPEIEPRQRALLYFHRGIILLRGLGEPGRALHDFEQAIATDPSIPQAADVRATIQDLQRRGILPITDLPRP
jgi:lipoprotein NlpI